MTILILVTAYLSFVAMAVHWKHNRKLASKKMRGSSESKERGGARKERSGGKRKNNRSKDSDKNGGSTDDNLLSDDIFEGTPQEMVDSDDLLSDTTFEGLFDLGEFGGRYRLEDPGLKWVQPGEVHVIHGFTIEKGMFYLGEAENYYKEPSAISNAHDFDEDSYLSLTPGDREKYLLWLSGGRNEKDVSNWILILYASGIERRLLICIDEKNSIELSLLLNEIKRIKTTYADRDDLKEVCNGMLRWLSITVPDVYPISDSDLTEFGDRDSFTFSVGRDAISSIPISAAKARIWLDILWCNKRVPSRRCPNEFEYMFQLEYKKKHGAGFLAHLSKSFAEASYRPKNSSIFTQRYSDGYTPDVIHLSLMEKKIVRVYNGACDQIDSFSRHMKDKDSVTVEAALRLPPEVMKHMDYTCVKDISRLPWSLKRNGREIIRYKEFMELFVSKEVTSIESKDVETIRLARRNLGIAIAPDPDIHGDFPDIEEDVLVYNVEIDRGITLSEKYKHALSLINISSPIISIGDPEVEKFIYGLHKKINTLIDIGKSPGRRDLHHYINWLRSGNHKRADDAIPAMRNKPKHKKRTIVKEFIDIFLKMDSPSAELKEIATSIVLGLGGDPKSIQANSIHNAKELFTENLSFRSARTTHEFRLDDQTIHQIEEETTEVKEILSKIFEEDSERHINLNEGWSPEKAGVTHPVNEFSLDEATISELEAETSKAKDLLSNIFDSEIAETTTEVDDCPEANSLGIYDEYKELVHKIIERDIWSRGELSAICRERGIMMDGVIEEVNDWAVERFDDTLIDSDDQIYVNIEIARAILNKEE